MAAIRGRSTLEYKPSTLLRKSKWRDAATHRSPQPAR
jgi:hypothetical protein